MDGTGRRLLPSFCTWNPSPSPTGSDLSALSVVTADTLVGAPCSPARLTALTSTALPLLPFLLSRDLGCLQLGTINVLGQIIACWGGGGLFWALQGVSQKPGLHLGW